jgi:hypothetical protein
MGFIGTVATAISDSAGTPSTNINTATVTLTLNTTIAVGQTLIGTIVNDNNATVATFSFDDTTHANSYTTDVTKVDAGNNTVIVTIFSCRVTTQLNSGNTITITSTGTPSPVQRARWAVSVQAYDNILNPRLDKFTSNAATGAAVSSGATATTTAANELVYGAFASGVRTFTAGSGFTAVTTLNTLAGSTERCLNAEWKYVTATAAQTATGTLSSSSVYAGAIATYKSSASNVPPTANAGPDQNVTVSSAVTLDGSGSSDSDGTITGYNWTQISGTSVTLSSSTVVNPTFTAPASPATLVFGLTVTDNNGATSPQDTVTINVANKIGYVGEAAGSTSTTSSTTFTLNYLKAVPAGHTVLIGIAVDGPVGSDNSPVLSALDTKSNSYVMNVAGYRTSTVGTAILSCRLGTNVTTSDTITITCTTTRGRWAVSAAEFDNIHASALDVTAHNDNPTATNPTTVGPTATSANQVEVVFASFGFGTANANAFSTGTNYSQAGTQRQTGTTSGHRGISSEYRIYTAAAAQTATGSLSPAGGYSAAIATYAADLISDTAPVANAGSNQTVAAFDTVTLDGTGSTDVDGTVTGYSWSQTVGPAVTLSSTTVAQPTFTAPGVNGGTSLTFSLVVTDNLGTNSTNSATVTITVNSAETFIARSSVWTGMPEYAANSGTWS